MIFKFDRYSNLKKWIESDVCQEGLDKTNQLVQGGANVQMLTGMEVGLTPPGKPLPRQVKERLVKLLPGRNLSAGPSRSS
ncbi:hypothetical protein [Kamptonema formosum]|uniref:hypothetical protein n=1 Tax=Kamptonema formosum TaxID=331992 RepID=UPI000344D6CA|nr:hypothetical protein [Oscillatoria sp. PCC 10802]